MNTERYELFFNENWGDAYRFWHKVINRSAQQIEVLREQINRLNAKTVRILDVGCGEGDELQKALAQIKGKRFEITANDTSTEALEQYKKNNSSNVTESIHSRLEQLPETLSKTFDFILFSHCLYTVHLDGLFNSFLKLLNDGGAMLVFLESKHGGIKKLAESCWKSVHGTPFDENVAEDLETELSKKGIQYSTTIIPYDLDLNTLRQIRENGFETLFAPFLFRKRDIPGNALKEIAFHAKTMEKNGKIASQTLAISIRKEGK